jgi:hypothetical protein
MLVLVTLVAPVAVFALLLALQWYEQRWLGSGRAPRLSGREADAAAQSFAPNAAVVRKRD